MNDETAARGEIAPSGIDARPRTVGLVLLACWLLLHVSVPLSYYLSSDIYDERFAWRMFSAVRVQECSLDARETTASGSVRPIALQSVLPLIPAKQRRLPPEDWLEQDALVCCPDPDERVVMRIERTVERSLVTEELT